MIDIHEHAERPGTYVANFTLCSVSGNGCSNESYYAGNVVYSDMLIRFTFFNQLNPLEEDLLYIFNPLEMRDYTDGLLCGISSADQIHQQEQAAAVHAAHGGDVAAEPVFSG